MTVMQLKSLARQHQLDHAGLGSVVVRCLCYSVLQMISMTIATNFFGDTYSSNASLFLLLMICFELAWSLIHATGIRKIGYLIAVAGMFVSGFCLIQQAISYNKQCEASSKTHNYISQ